MTLTLKSLQLVDSCHVAVDAKCKSVWRMLVENENLLTWLLEASELRRVKIANEMLIIC